MTATGYRGRRGPLPLGASLGRGGEGEVFALADGSGRALKIYRQPDAAREAKVRSMVEAGLSASCPNVAFPEDLAFQSDGSFAGFTMRMVVGCQPIHELYAPTSRRRVFPGAGWRFLVRAALNTARILDRVHAAGAVVGDINGSGVLVSQRAVASLIDADSFQWGADHPCRVGVPEFTPPELQGRGLHQVTRTINHDGFGLAVLVFELLFLGRHPHAGIPRGRDVPLARAIAKGAFAYSAVRQVTLVPPPGTLLLADLPAGLRVLFERAFAIGIGPRPRPSEWIEELGRLEAAISPCLLNSRHARPTPDGRCPWCRIERTSGTSQFGSGAVAHTNDADRQASSPVRMVAEAMLWRGRVGSGDRLKPAIGERSATPHGGADRLRGRIDGHRSAGAGGAGLTGDDRIERERRYILARDEHTAALDAWRNRTGAWQAHRATELLADQLRRHDRISLRHAAELRDVEPRLAAEKVRSALAAIPLATASIIGLGPHRIDVLATGGMVTAADLSRISLEALNVGERMIVALLLWRDALAVRISRRVSVPSNEVVSASAQVRYRHRAEIVASERILDGMARRLERIMEDLAVETGRRDPDLEKARLALDQAAADLPGHGPPLAFPASASVDVVAALQVARRATPTPAKKAANGCPRCGAPMVKRWGTSGAAPKRPFMGCTKYPACTGVRPLRQRKP